VKLPDQLRDNAAEWLISECPKRAEWAIVAADRIEALEAELARCHYFLRVIAGHAEDISTEAACALHPQIVVGGPSDD